jgi:hypothetical protein
MSHAPRVQKRDRSNENFKKRWRTFVKSGLQAHRDYHADVYILLRRKGQTYEFKSTDRAWPLTPEDLARKPTEGTLYYGKLTKNDRRDASLWCSR